MWDTNPHASLHDRVENKHKVICMCSWGISLQREHAVQTQHIIPAYMPLCAWRTVLPYVSRMWTYGMSHLQLCCGFVRVSLSTGAHYSIHTQTCNMQGHTSTVDVYYNVSHRHTQHTHSGKTDGDKVTRETQDNTRQTHICTWKDLLHTVELNLNYFQVIHHRLFISTNQPLIIALKDWIEMPNNLKQ